MKKNVRINNYNNFAFTLAEVLITIGIIGVVAALTIPTVQKKIFEAEQKTLYKKAYNTFSNALLKIKAENDNYQHKCYYGSNGQPSDFSECLPFKKELIKTLNVAKSCSTNALAAGFIPEYNGVDEINPSWSGACNGFNKNFLYNNDPVMVLTDGTIIIGYSASPSLFAFDINGKKPPNKWGHDIFVFFIRHSAPDKFHVGMDICSLVETGGKNTQQMHNFAFK